MLGHKGIRAAPEGNEEEGQRVTDVPKQRGSCRGQPPATTLAQAVKDVHVEDLPQRVGHEAGGGNTCDKQVEVGESAEPLP